MKRKNLILISCLAVVLAACVLSVSDFNDAERKLCDAGVYEMLTPELVEMYEREIAGESVVSQKTPAQLTRLAQRYNIEVNKLKAIMLLQDLAGKVDKEISLAELAAMNEMKLFAFFKQCGDAYLSTQSEERKTELKKMLADAVPGLRPILNEV